MLRESMQVSGRQVDVSGVTRGFDDSVDIPQALELVGFAEAVVDGDAARTAVARTALHAAIGDAGLVDAAAVVAAFHGYTRIADSIGIPYTTAAMGQDVPELRAAAGIDAFYRIAGEG